MSQNLKILILIILASVVIRLPAQHDNIVFRDLESYQGLSNNQVRAITQDKNGFIWIGTQYGLYKYDGYKFSSYSNRFDELTREKTTLKNAVFLLERSGMLWCGSNNGIYIINKRTDRVFHYPWTPNAPHNLNWRTLSNLFEDKQGIIWLGFPGGIGIQKYDKGLQIFEMYKINLEADYCNIYTLSTDLVDKERYVWLGSPRHGLLKYDRHRREFKQYKGSNSGAIVVIYQTPDNTDILWFGTLGEGLYKFNKRTEKATQYLHYANSTTKKNKSNELQVETNAFVLSILRAGDNQLWLGSLGGLFLFNTKSEQYKIYLHDPTNPKSISANSVSCLFLSCSKGDSVLWVGTRTGGLNKFYLKKKQFIRYRSIPNDTTSLSSDYISSVYEDKSGIL